MSAKKSRWKKMFGEIEKLDIPPNEKVVTKVVPAKVDGEVVGEAYIYDDGTVDVILKDDISTEASEKIQEVADETGFTLQGRLN